MSNEITSSNKEKPFQQDRLRDHAETILSGKIGAFTYCLENDQFYYFEKGYWRNLHAKEFMALIENGLTDDKGNKILTRFDVSRRYKVLDNFKLLKFKRLKEFNWSPLLNMENGMLNPYSGELEEHAQEFYSTIRVPYTFDMNAKCELWIKSINEIFEGNQLKINILQEFFGQCLTRDIKQEKGLLLLGESRSGKSTILHTFHNMVGNKNCSTVPLKYILNPVYTSQMINKLINFDKDVSKKAQEFEEDFKKIVTGEEIQANDKYKEPFSFTPFCKMVLSANEFPRITDHSSAFYNRLILIPCERVFRPEEQDKDLREKLLTELPGILNWSIQGLKKLNKRGRFEDMNFMKEALNDLEIENNPVYAFFEEHIEIELGNGIYITKIDLYAKYIQWAKNNGSYALSNIIFSKIVCKKFALQTPRDARLANNGPRIWRNIRYVDVKTEKTNIQWKDEPVAAINAVKPGTGSEIKWED